MGKDERMSEFPKFDGRLRDAVTDDMAAYVGEVMSSVAFRGGRKGVHGVRTAQELSSFGRAEVRHPYRRGADDGLDFRSAFGIERKMTPCASATVSRLAVQLGSFKEARDALALLGCGRMSASKVRDETLAAGGRTLGEQRRPPKDVRRYAEAQARTPEGGKAVRRTLVAMADGTNAPCVKSDTKGVRGKNGDEAHSRQLRVMNFFEYRSVDGKGTPVPIRGSFSYAVTDGDISETTGLLKVQGVARGSGTAPRMHVQEDHVPPRRGLRSRQDQADLPERTRGVGRGEGRTRIPRQAQGKHALRMAAQERLLHLVFARRGGREDSRLPQMQAGRDALAAPQRRVRLRHHRQAPLRSMRTAAMEAYFFNDLKSHPAICAAFTFTFLPFPLPFISRIHLPSFPIH